ncbi:MAG: hypothetical protein V4591_08995, partial [Bdellovibrionota bacterium]
MILTIFLIVSTVVGVFLGLLLAKLFAKRSRLSLSGAEAEDNINVILASAQSQREIILEEALKATKEQHAIELERINNERNSIIRLNENIDLELNGKQSEVDKFENSLLENEEKLKEKEDNIKHIYEKTQVIQSSQTNLLHELERQLENKASLPKNELLLQMQGDLVNTEKLGITKWL